MLQCGYETAAQNMPLACSVLHGGYT